MCINPQINQFKANVTSLTLTRRTQKKTWQNKKNVSYVCIRVISMSIKFICYKFKAILNKVTSFPFPMILKARIKSIYTTNMPKDQWGRMTSLGCKT